MLLCLFYGFRGQALLLQDCGEYKMCVRRKTVGAGLAREEASKATITLKTYSTRISPLNTSVCRQRRHR